MHEGGVWTPLTRKRGMQNNKGRLLTLSTGYQMYPRKPPRQGIHGAVSVISAFPSEQGDM